MKYLLRVELNAFQLTEEAWAHDSPLWPQWLRDRWCAEMQDGPRDNYFYPRDADDPDGPRWLRRGTTYCSVARGMWIVRHDLGQIECMYDSVFDRKYEALDACNDPTHG